MPFLKARIVCVSGGTVGLGIKGRLPPFGGFQWEITPERDPFNIDLLFLSLKPLSL